MIIKEFTLDQFFGATMGAKMRAEELQDIELQKLRLEQKPILDDLLAVGYKMDTVWMLVNTNELYPEALPVLLKHLQLPYSERIKEGVIRSLIVNEFRGLAGPTVLTEFKKLENVENDDAPLVFPFLMAIQCLADRSMTADLEAMLADPKYAGIVSYLEKAIRKSKRK
jgi:hypothetical protein